MSIQLFGGLNRDKRKDFPMVAPADSRVLVEDPERQELIEGAPPSPSIWFLFRLKIAAALLLVGVVSWWIPKIPLVFGRDATVGASDETSGFSWSRKDATKEAQKTTDEWEKRGCPDAPLLDFYMYRAQTDENYSPVNQDMANIGGMLWYLHNEIIWHHWIRVGSFSSTPKTRLEQWRIKMRPTCQLWNKGLTFGIVNTYDLGECTGPFKCQNIKHYGPTVGCETWDEGKMSHFPHEEWFHRVKYPHAAWYSLPGACSSKKFWAKDKGCALREPSGACPDGVEEPTGEIDCTYTYKKVGEISIDELEGISSFDDLMKKGGYEYSRSADKGKMLHFWDNINSTDANQRRIDITLKKFMDKYPDHPYLEDPTCDFDPRIFFPHWPKGDFH